MIFAVLGTQKFQLNRLLIQLDQAIEDGFIQEEVFAQIGNSDYFPRHFSYKDFMNKEDFDAQVEKSDVLITHSGVGSIISGLKSNRPIIVFPRLRKFQEHVDDHQLDIAQAFEKKGYVLCCYENDSLVEKIEQARNFQFQTYHSQRKQVVGIISDFINEQK